MTKTVVGLFDRFDEAQQVVQELVDGGFPRGDISVVANDARGEYASASRQVGDDKMDNTAEEQAGSGAVAGALTGGVLGLLVGVGALAIPGIGPVIAAGPLVAALGSTALGAGLGAASGALVGPLVDAGIPRPEAEVYNEGVRRGGTLVTVRTSDTMADEAADIMRRYDVIDIDQRSDEYRSSGWNGYTETDQPYTTQDMDRFTTTRTTNVDTTPTRRNVDSDAVLPVIEEDLQVGKRQQQRTARVYTHVTERPVEEQVTLRDEHVEIERQPVNRPVNTSDAFQETTFEVTETTEQPVVAKQARVIEEVRIHKDVEERTETIRDTVRRQDVEIDRDATTTDTGYGVYDNDFRSYYTSNLANSGYTYEQYQPVFRYGHSLSRSGQSDWTTIEPEARRHWEERNPGTWEQFKDSIRYAWDRARSKV
ncbi:MAG: hypothetical protein OHK0022_26550 [Roseiflexaceae bacterium]